MLRSEHGQNNLGLECKWVDWRDAWEDPEDDEDDPDEDDSRVAGRIGGDYHGPDDRIRRGMRVRTTGLDMDRQNGQIGTVTGRVRSQKNPKQVRCSVRVKSGKGRDETKVLSICSMFLEPAQDPNTGVRVFDTFSRRMKAVGYEERIGETMSVMDVTKLEWMVWHQKSPLEEGKWMPVGAIATLYAGKGDSKRRLKVKETIGEAEPKPPHTQPLEAYVPHIQYPLTMRVTEGDEADEEIKRVLEAEEKGEDAKDGLEVISWCHNKVEKVMMMELLEGADMFREAVWAAEELDDLREKMRKASLPMTTDKGALLLMEPHVLRALLGPPNIQSKTITEYNENFVFVQYEKIDMVIEVVAK